MGGCSFFYLQYSTLVGYVQGKLEETVVILGDTKTILIFCVKSEIEHISIRFRLYKYWKHWEKYMKNLCVKCCYNHWVIVDLWFELIEFIPRKRKFPGFFLNYRKFLWNPIIQKMHFVQRCAIFFTWFIKIYKIILKFIFR